MSDVRTIILVWALLLLLLAATVLASFVLTGPLSLGASLSIAAAKAGLIYWFYMHLREEGGLVRLAALGALVWLLILFMLSSADFLPRYM